MSSKLRTIKKFDWSTHPSDAHLERVQLRRCFLSPLSQTENKNGLRNIARSWFHLILLDSSLRRASQHCSQFQNGLVQIATSPEVQFYFKNTSLDFEQNGSTMHEITSPTKDFGLFALYDVSRGTLNLVNILNIWDQCTTWKSNYIWACG